MDRVKADQIGMLATVMNCIYTADMFRTVGIKSHIMTPFACGSMTELFSKDQAIEYLEKGEVVFFAGGTGHPYFSTDTATVLMAIEVCADVILSAKAIDGVYDSEPKTNPNAKKYDKLDMSEIVDKKLGVIDLASAVLAMENKMPMLLFGLNQDRSIVKAVTDGFTGNVFLKTIEGFGKLVKKSLTENLKKNIFTTLGAIPALPSIKRFSKTMDYKEYGGALFLGVKQPVVKAHGSSDEYLFYCTIKQAERFAKSGTVELIKEEFEKK